MPRDLTRNAAESEKAIELYLVKRVEEIGGLCLKYVNAHYTGLPDRLILLTGIPDVWVEVKSKGRCPTPLQEHRHAQLRALGRRVCVVDSREKVDNLITDLKYEV